MIHQLNQRLKNNTTPAMDLQHCEKVPGILNTFILKGYQLNYVIESLNTVIHGRNVKYVINKLKPY